MFQFPNNAPWMERSKCGNDRELLKWQTENREEQYFDDNERNRWSEAAKNYCKNGCPVLMECLNHALEHNESGIWAGTTGRERRAAKRKAERAALKFLERLHRKEQSETVQSDADSAKEIA